VKFSKHLKRERLLNDELKYDSLTYDVVYFNLQKAISKQKSKHNLVLFDGDSIVIPKILDVVQITGDLQNINGSSNRSLCLVS
jgi:hypothetical protein